MTADKTVRVLISMNIVMGINAINNVYYWSIITLLVWKTKNIIAGVIVINVLFLNIVYV